MDAHGKHISGLGEDFSDEHDARCSAELTHASTMVDLAAETDARAAFLYTPMDCQSCLGNCIHPADDGMYPCVTQLEADVVVQKMQELQEADPA